MTPSVRTGTVARNRRLSLGMLHISFSPNTMMTIALYSAGPPGTLEGSANVVNAFAAQCHFLSISLYVQRRESVSRSRCELKNRKTLAYIERIESNAWLLSKGSKIVDTGVPSDINSHSNLRLCL